MNLFRFGQSASNPDRTGRAPSPIELLVQAQAQIDTGAAEAVALCDRALAAGADEGRALEIRGRARQRLGQNDPAWEDLERAVTLGRRSAALFRARWTIADAAGRNGAA